MARGPVHNFSLVRQDRKAQMVVREAGVARIKLLLADGPRTPAELSQILAEELQVVRATVFGYVRYMHKSERSIRPTGEMRGRGELWTLGADPALPAVDEAPDGSFACATVPARQIGMCRDGLVAALFGPAQQGVAA